MKLFMILIMLSSNLYAADKTEKLDFSENLLVESINTKAPQKDILEIVKSQDIQHIWMMKKPRNGVFGRNYRRIEFKFIDINKKTGLTYFVRGKSRLKKNICEFTGELKVLKAVQYLPGAKETVPIVILGKYELLEKTASTLTGKFSGSFRSYCYFSDDKRILLDSRWDVADGYNNNTFVGIWTDLKRDKNYKCIWGDYRLPYTGDFDEGAGELKRNCAT